jgi:hypothetical protein
MDSTLVAGLAGLIGTVVGALATLGGTVLVQRLDADDQERREIRSIRVEACSELLGALFKQHSILHVMEDAAVTVDGIDDGPMMEFLNRKRHEGMDVATRVDNALALVYVVVTPETAAAANEPVADMRSAVATLEAIMFDGADPTVVLSDPNQVDADRDASMERLGNTCRRDNGF